MLTLTFLFPAIDCDIEKITNLPQNDGLQTDGIEIEFDNTILSCVATLHNSALWNMDSKGGYWHYSFDIKTYLIIDSQGNLKVTVCSPWIKYFLLNKKCYHSILYFGLISFIRYKLRSMSLKVKESDFKVLSCSCLAWSLCLTTTATSRVY